MDTMEGIRRIVDFGISFDCGTIGTSAIKDKMKDFFDGEGFVSEIKSDGVYLEKDGAPCARLYLDESGISFKFFYPQRAIQIILLTLHMLKYFEEVASEYENLRDQGIYIVKNCIEE